MGSFADRAEKRLPDGRALGGDEMDAEGAAERSSAVDRGKTIPGSGGVPVFPRAADHDRRGSEYRDVCQF